MHIIKIILFHIFWSFRPIVIIPCRIMGPLFLITFALTTFSGALSFKLTWGWLVLGMILPVISWYYDSLLIILMPDGTEDRVI